ncbi:hypothetical protein HPB47_006465, partial [Ixodes persulcatus]
ARLSYEPRKEGGIAVHAVQWYPKVLKAELLELIAKEKSLRPGFDKYRADSIAEQHRHVVLRLPHCELVCSQVKRHAASQNATFTLTNVEAFLPAAINQ